MKGLFSKVVVGIAGAVALIGISVANTKASVPDISDKSALYLEHGKSIGSSIDTLNWHTSHGSHVSHVSHGSHQSHSSGW